MKVFLLMVFVFFLLFLQIGVFPHLEIAGVFPNLILLSILSLSILQGWKKILPWTIVGGLFLDFYSLNNVLGVSVVGLLIVSYLAYFLSQNIFKKENVSSLILIFLITIFIYNFWLIILFSIFPVAFDFRFLGFIIGIIYNLIFALPVFWLIKKCLAKNTK